MVPGHLTVTLVLRSLLEFHPRSFIINPTVTLRYSNVAAENPPSIHMYIYIYIYTHTHIYIYIYIYVCVYMYIYIYICVCVCVRVVYMIYMDSAWIDFPMKTRMFSCQHLIPRGMLFAPKRCARMFSRMLLKIISYIYPGFHRILTFLSVLGLP